MANSNVQHEAKNIKQSLEKEFKRKNEFLDSSGNVEEESRY